MNNRSWEQISSLHSILSPECGEDLPIVYGCHYLGKSQLPINGTTGGMIDKLYYLIRLQSRGMSQSYFYLGRPLQEDAIRIQSLHSVIKVMYITLIYRRRDPKNFCLSGRIYFPSVYMKETSYYLPITQIMTSMGYLTHAGLIPAID